MFSSNTSGPGVATDPQFNYVTMLLHGNGTNGAQNNTFLDSSTNNFTITRNGNTTQGTFSPYGNNWSNYFDGSGDSLSITSATAFDFSADFTVEGWFNFAQMNQVATATVLFSTDVVNRFQINTLSSGNVIQFYENSGTASISVSNPISIGSWNHIALVRTGTTIGLFVNGSRIGSYTSSFSFDVGALYIGQQTPGYSNHWFNGYASNVRVIKGSGPYNATQSTLTVPTSPLTAITNTSLLTCQSNRFRDASTNAFTITRNGDVSVQRFSPFNPTAPYAAGTDGGSGYFDGSGDYLDISSNSVLTPSGDFTIEFWAYPTSASGIREWYSKGNGIQVFSNGTAWSLALSSNNSGTYFINASFGTLVANQWQHIVVTRSGNSYVGFVNGVATSLGTSSSAPSTGTDVLRIGDFSGSAIYPVVGYMSAVRFVNGTAVYGTSTFTPPTTPPTAITNTSFLTNFTNAGIIDNAEMNNLETVGNAQISTAQSKFGGGSMYFDGSGDALALPANINLAMGTGDFTIEMWVYGANSGSTVGGSYPRIFTFGTAQGAGCIESYNAAGTMYVDISGAGGPITFTASTLLNSTWNHYAIARSGTSLKAFVNGTQVGSATNSTNINLAATTQSWIGAISASAGNFNGYIDDLRITKGYARYTANFTAPTAPFPDN